MGGISSINFKKSVDYQVFHNSTIRPSYIIGGELECDPPKGYDALNLKNQIIENAKQAYKANCKARNKEFQATNYAWSAVCNIKPETTMDDLKKLAEHFNKKYGFQCYQIAIHRDEGYINDDGEKEINHHAHLEFITLDKENGKQLFKLRDFNPQKMREIQTEVAEILQMERGQDKRISGAKRIEPRQYAKMKEQERANQKALKNELESTKKELESVKTELESTKKPKNLSKSAIHKRLLDEKRTYANANKILKDKGLAPIYTATHYNSNDYLKGLENGAYATMAELEKALKALNKRILKEHEQGKNAEHHIKTTEKIVEKKVDIDFEKSAKQEYKNKIIDDFYTDLSKKHDFTRFYFNAWFKEFEKYDDDTGKTQYKIKDDGDTIKLHTSDNKSLKEQVAIVLDIAKAKGWKLENISYSGNKAFCDEVARQIAEIKAKEKAEQERKLKELEKQNEQLKAELAKNRTETALKAQNEPLKDEITPKIEKSQNQLDLEFLKELRKGILNKKEVNALYGVFNRLEMITEKTKLNVFADTIATPYDDIEKAEKKLEKQLIIEQKLTFKKEPSIDEQMNFINQQNMKRYLEKQKQEVETKSKEKDKGIEL